MIEFSNKFNALPIGTFYGFACGRRYVVSKTPFANGRSFKLVAEELGGTDYISLNLYNTAHGPRLRPCEMPSDKVIQFVKALVPARTQPEARTGL